MLPDSSSRATATRLKVRRNCSPVRRRQHLWRAGRQDGARGRASLAKTYPWSTVYGRDAICGATGARGISMRGRFGLGGPSWQAQAANDGADADAASDSYQGASMVEW